MSGRLREEDGFTLMEVLVAMTLGFVVFAATMGLLQSTVTLSTGVMGKTDAMQRGRLAMDKITQELRSQVCLDLDHPAILQGATANSVTFYSDFSEADGTKPPERRTLTLDPATSMITTRIYRTSVLNPTPASYPGTPSLVDATLENATLRKDKDGNDVPFLTYWAYTTVNGHPETAQLLTPPLDAASAARVARIEINFLARPTGAKNNAKAVAVSDQISVRHADPNLSVPDPACV
ncbi:MAG TPA: prepilin-type N-terminal cleavage/methylation domain-containing protein [Solirubrobacteraceae bacterium]|nr:prepilin-type N-terminal cleavage/methylation domain-containing protein [Solirubrobacteraceae bacterium]